MHLTAPSVSVSAGMLTGYGDNLMFFACRES